LSFHWIAYLDDQRLSDSLSSQNVCAHARYDSTRPRLLMMQAFWFSGFVEVTEHILSIHTYKQ
jgi:hypothetical protein